MDAPKGGGALDAIGGKAELLTGAASGFVAIGAAPKGVGAFEAIGGNAELLPEGLEAEAAPKGVGALEAIGGNVQSAFFVSIVIFHVEVSACVLSCLS